MTSRTDLNYEHFLSQTTRAQWKRIGVRRRAGVAVPLFSLYSRRSVGIGEIPDLTKLIDWCGATSMSIIQLLPMNDVGFEFRPYDAQSTFALDPMYLALGELREIDSAKWAPENDILRTRFPCGGKRVNYEIKGAKLEVLWRIFEGRSKKSQRFEVFKSAQGDWLQDFVLFKVMKEQFEQAGWMNWPEELKRRVPESLESFQREHQESLEFQRWLQWQLFEQFLAVKAYAVSKGVLLMGDLPFLVASDSADVWAQQNYFNLELSSGAPPDVYLAKGQRWGMPPYRWEAIASDDYRYLQSKLRYAQNFYDFFRIDHVVGVFRLWTISVHEPVESGGMNGTFEPQDESVWDEHGRKLLTKMIESSQMLPCAEDLGVIPGCCFTTLEDFGIVGMDVQRWSKHWGSSYDFKTTDAYRKNSIAVISTHDMSSLKGWWFFEADTMDQALFERKCGERGLDGEALKRELFDLEYSAHGRLRWKGEINSADVLLARLGRPVHEVGDFVDCYKGTYGERKKFLNLIEMDAGVEEASFDEVTEKAMEKAAQAQSIFSVQLLQDLLSLEGLLDEDAWDYRINVPGTTNKLNWTLRIPFALEDFREFSLNEKIEKIHQNAERM